MTTPIAISRAHFPVTTLGPGRRLGVWLQGCSIRCRGCVSMDTWTFGRGATTVESLLDDLASWIAAAEGFSISGGEPFDQPDALLALLRGLRARSTADVLAFSGYPFETLRAQLVAADGLIDALVSDPYDRGAPQTLPLRGGDNQRLHLLTPIGRARFAPFERPAAAEPPRLDVMFDEDGAVWFAGIPRRGDLERLSRILEVQGHVVAISEDRRERS